MDIYKYTALKNPRGASDVVASYRIQPARNPQDLSSQLAFCVSKRGQEALDRIAKVHPDFHLIQSNIKNPIPETIVVEDKKETKSNACGCSSCNVGNGFNNADGQSMKSDVKYRLSPTTDVIITGGLVLIGLALVLKLIK